jgi:hypothetical protein
MARGFATMEKGRAVSAALYYFQAGFLGGDAGEIRQPAARRLSAEDLPERRSATIS